MQKNVEFWLLDCAQGRLLNSYKLFGS